MKPRRTLRGAVALALLVIACSSSRDEDEGCGPGGKRPCTSAADCEGFTDSFFPPDDRCSVVSCGADGLCKQDRIRDTDLDDDQRGDCKKPRCDGSGHVVLVVSKGDTGGSFGSSSCRRKRCVDGLFGGATPEEVSELDGVRCQLEGREGVCASGACMAVPAEPPKRDGGDSSTADAGDDDGGTTDASTD